MRRTERLFQIIQILRSSHRPVTGHNLAQELEVSLRTLYRDIAELVAQGVPVRGEAGIGYVLGSGYDLPPLMLTEAELEAAVLGAAWVATHGDSELSNGARDLVAKLTAVIPEELRPILLDAGLRPVSFTKKVADGLDMASLRRAIRGRCKVDVAYIDAKGAASQRRIWPVFIAYMEEVRLVVAWCELRQALRSFRTDRVQSLTVTDIIYPVPRQQLVQKWQDRIAEECLALLQQPPAQRLLARLYQFHPNQIANCDIAGEVDRLQPR